MSGRCPASGAPARGLGTPQRSRHSMLHVAAQRFSHTHPQRKPCEMPEQAVAPGPWQQGASWHQARCLWALLGEALLGRASTAGRTGLSLPCGSQAASSFQRDPGSLCPPSEHCAARTPSLAQSTYPRPRCRGLQPLFPPPARRWLRLVVLLSGAGLLAVSRELLQQWFSAP